ncbi:hypothetical protein Scep_026091 [Stephania cephalantha]|uniref:Uncharacterized protein n=1 Tax=Stephania cephalantha TaxID=152367 RepID=A0AAP0EPR2_9MAGN
MLGSFWRETKRFGILSKLALQISPPFVCGSGDREAFVIAWRALEIDQPSERYIAIEV